MLELKDVQKRYQYQKVLHHIHMTLPDHGMIGIVGPSGCGKSTLLNIIGGIDKDYSGSMYYNQKKVDHYLAKYRRKHVSFIFQSLHLIMWLSVFSNIHLSQYFSKQKYHKSAYDIKKVKKISALSYGQRQRLSYLRATASQKDILLCDEPTGSLDHHHAQLIMQYLKEQSVHCLVIIVSHDTLLVKQYCDEIYTMRDGALIKHQVNRQVLPIMKQEETFKRIRFPFFKLSFFSLMSHKLRTSQLVFGLSLSMLCIMVTFTLSGTLKKEINRYIYSLIPPSTISFQVPSSSALTFNDMNTFLSIEGIKKTHLFLNDFELLGIGFHEERYQESQTLFIGDDASSYDQLTLKYGRYPQDNQEIMVSLSTAEHLSEGKDIKALIDCKVISWYKYQNEIIAIPLYIVGIASQSTSVDSIYQRDNAYISLLAQKGYESTGTMGLLFVDVNYSRQDVMKQLQQHYPRYDFIETGASTSKQVSSTIQQIEYVLSLFSLLAVLSSLFLIGEVMFFNMIQKKKDYAIMVCFGANMWSFLRMVLYESLLITVFSMLCVFIVYYQLIYALNRVFQYVLFNESIVLYVDYQLLIGVFLFALGLVIASQVIPFLYIMKMNTVDALKS